MARLPDRTRWPGPEYHVQATFRAPLPFVFRWCTDYSPGDAKLEGEKYRRAVVQRTRRRVVFEDLEDSSNGWDWARCEVELMPPDRWHMESTGNHREVVADYILTKLPGGRTRLDLRWRRRPGILEFIPRTKAAAERATKLGWKNFARALERDYRTGRSGRGS